MFMIWFERKIIADMQNRIGPNTGRPVGHPPDAGRRHQVLLQGRPAPRARRPARLPPGAVPVARARVPDVRGRPDRRRLRDGDDGIVTIFGHDTFLQVADPPIGILFVLAMSSIAVYGVMLAGWSSGSKYPLLGSVRASAQMVSLRGGARPVGRHGRARQRHALDARHRRPSQDRARSHWNFVATGVVPFVDLPHRRHRRAEPAAVRPRRGRAGARRRLPHRVRVDPLRPVLPRRVHEHVTMSAIIVTLFLGGPSGPLRFGARAWIWPTVLVLREGVRLPVHVRLVPGHAAPASATTS